MFVYFKGNIDTSLLIFSFQFSILTQSFNVAINDVYILSLRLFWQSWHTHDVAHNDNDHLCSIVDDYIADVEVEVLRNAVSFWIC